MEARLTNAINQVVAAIVKGTIQVANAPRSPQTKKTGFSKKPGF